MLKLKMKKNYLKYLEIAMLMIMTIGYFGASTVKVGAVSIYVDGDKIDTGYMGITTESAKKNIEKKLSNAGYSSQALQIEKNLSGKYLMEDQEVKVSTLKMLTIKADDKTYIINTYDNTVGELKAEKGLENIKTNFPDDTKLDVVDELGKPIILDVNSNVRIETETLYSQTEYVDDATMYVGDEETVQEGSDGYRQTTYQDTYVNGELDKTNVLGTTEVPAQNTIIHQGTKEIPTSANTSEWNQIAMCESGGNWSTDTGNGYSGGLQISDSTWSSYAPSLGISAEKASEATPSEQMLVADQILASQGWGAWQCSIY